jgi:hypothetical protein
MQDKKEKKSKKHKKEKKEHKKKKEKRIAVEGAIDQNEFGKFGIIREDHYFQKQRWVFSHEISL